MKKRIIVCCDGTWNEPENIKDKIKVPTNVLKMLRAVTPRDEEHGFEQVVFYNEGVGTGGIGIADKMIGGGMGAGISQNIQSAYRFLANNYVKGDQIFLFGFSRGAYTARSLAGLLTLVGVLEKTDLRYVPEAYEYYHIKPKKRKTSPFHSFLEGLDRDKFENERPIKFIGVWDTVGSLGVPTPILGRVQALAGKYWRPFRVGFHDCSLCPTVENAYQALAIDERRGPFRPSIWDETKGQRVVKQVWFAGVHSNVGGGYPDCGLSDIALNWMVNRAMECGLKMDAEFLRKRINPDETGKLENSYSVGYKILQALRVKPYPRVLGEHLEVGEMIHESVLTRIRSDKKPLYRPVNLGTSDNLLDTVQDKNKSTLLIKGVEMPVFREREHLRIWTDNAKGTAAVSGQPAESCKIINFTKERGARLKLDRPILVGSELNIDSAITGDQDAIVVWDCKGETGIKFVA